MTTAVMIVPTGIGARIGGHSGDATSAANLLAATVDTLIVHPNIANGSDLYNMPANALYVEGSMLDKMMAGRLWLRPQRGNNILVLVNKLDGLTRMAIASAASIYGVNATVLELTTPLQMVGGREADTATGSMYGVDALITQIRDLCRPFDAIAIHTPIEVNADLARLYMELGGINPWGLVEAMVSRKVSSALKVPCAHAPLEVDPPEFNIAKAHHRVAPEMICSSHLVSVLAGLRDSPAWVGRAGDTFVPQRPGDIGIENVDILVSPLCWGTPHVNCRRNNIPIMWVMDNVTDQHASYMAGVEQCDIQAANYLEAAGHLVAMGIGRTARSVLADPLLTRCGRGEAYSELLS